VKYFCPSNYAARGENGSIMVGMFVCLCLARKKPSEREFFVPARTDLGVKLLTNLSKDFVGTVKLACHCLNTRLQLRVFSFDLLKYLSNRTSKTLLKCYYSVPQNFVFCRFFFGLRAVLISSRQPQYIKNAY